jgi:hypothetical protein
MLLRYLLIVRRPSEAVVRHDQPRAGGWYAITPRLKKMHMMAPKDALS